MNMKPFDRTQVEEYATQAKAQWGKTDAYREFEQKTEGKTWVEMESAGGALMDILGRSELSGICPRSPGKPRP